jgi:hypothetical protein
MRSRAIIILVLVGCGGGGGGDDGGGDDGGGDDSSECSEIADTCAGESICIAGACEDAFNRIYEITDVEVAVPTTDPNGEEWDVGGGAPDLLLEVSMNGSVVASAPAIADSFSATFPGPFTAQVVAGSALVLVAYDEDLTVNDYAYACQVSPLTADLLRLRLLTCTTGGSSLSFAIAPR